MAKRQQHGARDIRDMDAREDLARLVDATRRARLHLIDRTAAGSVDAGQAEDVDGRARLHAHRLPGALGRQALDAARLRRAGGRFLVDPAAAMVAIDAGGRQVAQPARLAQHTRRGLQRGIAGGVRERWCTARASPCRTPRPAAPRCRRTDAPRSPAGSARLPCRSSGRSRPRASRPLWQAWRFQGRSSPGRR